LKLINLGETRRDFATREINPEQSFAQSKDNHKVRGTSNFTMLFSTNLASARRYFAGWAEFEVFYRTVKARAF